MVELNPSALAIEVTTVVGKQQNSGSYAFEIPCATANITESCEAVLSIGAFAREKCRRQESQVDKCTYPILPCLDRQKLLFHPTL